MVGCWSEPKLPSPEKIDSTLSSKFFCSAPSSAKSGLVSRTHQSGKSFSIGIMSGNC